MTNSLFKPDIESLHRATPWIKRVCKYWNAAPENRIGVYTNLTTGLGFQYLAFVPLDAVGFRLPSALSGRATGIAEADADWAQWVRPVFGFDSFGPNAGRNFWNFLEIVGAPGSIVGAFAHLVFPRVREFRGENPDDLVGRGGLPDHLERMRERGELRLIRRRLQPNYYAGGTRRAGDVVARIDVIFRNFTYHNPIAPLDGYLEAIAFEGELQVRFQEFSNEDLTRGTFDVLTSRYRFKKDCCFC